jgi:hypothetical protein
MTVGHSQRDVALPMEFQILVGGVRIAFFSGPNTWGPGPLVGQDRASAENPGGTYDRYPTPSGELGKNRCRSINFPRAGPAAPSISALSTAPRSPRRHNGARPAVLMVSAPMPKLLGLYAVPPSSGWMKPYPFWRLNHFTVLFRLLHSSLHAEVGELLEK